MQRQRLRDIANIRTGFQFRSKVVPDNCGNVYAVLLKAMQPEIGIEPRELIRTHVERLHSNSLLQPGQILFRARGASHTAYCYRGESRTLLPAAQFFIISPKVRHILPEYIAWYINSISAQAYLGCHSAGSGIRAIKKTILEDMEIPQLPMRQQQLIVSIEQLRCREKWLRQRICEKRDLLTNTMLSQQCMNNKGM